MRAVGVIDYATADREFKAAIAEWFEAHGVPITSVVRFEIVAEGVVRYWTHRKDSEGRIVNPLVGGWQQLVEGKDLDAADIRSDIVPPFPTKGTWIEYPDGIPS